MKIEDIFNFFKSCQTLFLSNELAVCYIAFVLVHGDSYGTELMRRLEVEYPGCRLSDTILHHSLKFLMREEIVTTYLQRVDGRGRPRRMYQIQPGAKQQAQELARFWQEYMERSVSRSVSHTTTLQPQS